MTESYSDDFLAGAQHVTNRLTRYLSDDESDWWRGYRAGRYDAKQAAQRHVDQMRDTNKEIEENQ